MTTFALKALFVASLVGMAVGAWSQFRHKPVEWELVVFAAMFGSVGGPVALLFLVGIPVGVMWLFS